MFFSWFQVWHIIMIVFRFQEDKCKLSAQDWHQAVVNMVNSVVSILILIHIIITNICVALSQYLLLNITPDYLQNGVLQFNLWQAFV